MADTMETLTLQVPHNQDQEMNGQEVELVDQVEEMATGNPFAPTVGPGIQPAQNPGTGLTTEIMVVIIIVEVPIYGGGGGGGGAGAAGAEGAPNSSGAGGNGSTISCFCRTFDFT